ncbi:HNH endonuclease [Bradyrhizobium sp. SRS-191]|uniref:HNH endonuclease n=1 Tax=Bradyrhizobium sp. SRS-191 TaxID=2962606 RepID=UPI00211EE45D|nr:HNH endonuclease [Bradyrhizobium sp. SRS-191]
MTASTIYNRIENTDWIVWLAGASGIDRHVIRKAANNVNPKDSAQTQAKALRQVLTWPLLASHLEERRNSATASPQILVDIEEIKREVNKPTTRQALIAARLGQGQFRADLEKTWQSACAVSGCEISAVLRASHVKPWSESTNDERLNPENGLLLAAHIDALFDRGLLAFTDDGTMLLSKRISVRDRELLGLSGRLRHSPTEAQRRFLACHRRIHRLESD